MTKPVDLKDKFTQDVFEYLDLTVNVHDSGSVAEAASVVQDGYGLSRQDAHGFAVAWEKERTS